jgi:uncharacterized protein (TIGR03437 family)
MEIINHTIYSLFFAASVGARNLRWIPVCVLLAAVAAGQAQLNQPRQPRPRRAEPATSLHGEAAVQRLKADGDYASLGAAVAAAGYQINVQPAVDPILTQQRKLTAADGAANDVFGDAVALSGDTLVIGAPDDDEIGEGQGSVYVFTRSFTSSGANWTQQQRLIANDGAEGDQFGGSVAISGDTIVVSAPLDDIGANSAQGSAYVFVRSFTSSGAVWTQQQKLVANDGSALDFLGLLSVAVSGDTVVLGSVSDDIGVNTDQGSAYVFTRSGTVWTQQQKLTADDGASGDQFGRSVALSGDTIVVSANTDKIGANIGQGSVYVFTRSGANWSQRQKLIADDGAANDSFGVSVAISGDTVVVGASSSDDIGANTDQGSAYVFTRSLTPSGAVWTQQQKLTASDGAALDDFGFRVAISGDTVVVSAPLDDIGGNFDLGSVYVFARSITPSGAVWTQQRKLTVDDGAAFDRFAFSVALSGDTVVAGAPLADIGANKDQGSAYVFVIRENNHVQQQQLLANDGAANEGFGFSVALSGDTVVVGAGSDDIGANADQGSAYVFTRNGGVWTLQQKLIANDGSAGDFFGISMALSGDTVVVGAFEDAIGANTAQGSAYVFTRSGGVWTLQQKLTAGDGGTNDLFGRSVAISGESVVVGAGGYNDFQGAAYVFTRSGTVWTQQQRLTANDGAAFDVFGLSVAISGDTVVVGAPDVISANESQGSAYVFTRSGTAWTQQQKLTASDGAPGDHFGISVALSGDTAVVGANIEDIGPNADQGSAYVFTRSGTAWIQQQKLTANDGAPGDHFGISVALSGDTVVVGANIDDVGTNADQGAAYVFTRSITPGGAVWTQQQRLIADDGAAGDVFGVSVAISGDTVVVGAPSDDIGANANQGSAYAFVSPACQTITLDPASLPDGITGNSYRQAVTASGGSGPYQFSLSDGALPPGLTLAQNGQISGTPTTAGTYSFTITATILSSLCPGSRSYTLTVTGDSACNFSVVPSNHAFPSGGGKGVVSVNAADGCAWMAVSNDPWIMITSGANGNGNGEVNFAVSNNPNAGSRRGTLTIAGHKVTVVQAALVACVSAASFIGNSLATESIVAAFGTGLAKSTAAATIQPLPETLAGTRVSVLDSLGAERFAPLFFVSPTQINFQIPPGTAAGQALVTIIHDGETVAAASPQIEMISPGLFSANASGQGLMIGVAVRLKADNSLSFEPVVRFDQEQQQFVAMPIDLGPETDRVFLVLFATGLRHRSSLGAVNVQIGGVNTEVLFAGPQGSFVGLDQLNVSLPRSLAGRGEVELSVLVEGHEANKLRVAIK